MTEKALIVEDEHDTGELLAEVLRRHNMEPTLLVQGKPAVAWVHAHRPRLILLDLMLPDMDGYNICEELKLDRATNLIPIIMVTARDQPADRVHGLEVGANFYLTKPFSVEELNRAIDEVLRWSEDLQQKRTDGEVSFHLQSDTQYLEQLNQLLSVLFMHSGLRQEQIKQLTVAVRELGSNAIEWGHRKQVDRVLRVTYRIDQEKVTLMIRDSGPGFNPQSLPHAAQTDDPVSHLMVREVLGLREGGFGIMIARGMVDELEYNEKGNEVKLAKYLSPVLKE